MTRRCTIAVVAEEILLLWRTSIVCRTCIVTRDVRRLRSDDNLIAFVWDGKMHDAHCGLTTKLSHPGPKDVNRDSGTVSANPGWLQRLVRPHRVLPFCSA